MTSLLTKICGLTTPADALHAADCGADFLGFITVPGSRRRAELPSIRESLEQVRKIHPQVLGVLVTLDLPVDEILEQARFAGVDAVQLHGSETPEQAAAVREAGYLIIKAVPIGPGAPGHDWLHYPCDYRLIDTYHGGASGGTGRLLDPALLPPPTQRGQAPLLLAGGLTPENLLDAVRLVQPQGVDVSSGVETSPGIKDPEKVRRFLELALQA